jgi:membrane fusion protein (multidrug efflux system)
MSEPQIPTPGPNAGPVAADVPPERKKRNVLAVVGVAFGLSIGIYGYFLYQKYWPYTDDAYIAAHVVDVAAQVSGPVAHIYVHNNEFVEANHPLFDIDPRPFQAQVAQAKANLKLAIQQMQTDEAGVAVAQANVDNAKAQLVVNQKNYDRTSILVLKGQASVASGDDALGALQSSQAALVAAQKQLVQAQSTLGDVGNRNAQIQQARAALNEALVNLGYTHVYAPADAFVTNFEVRVGTTVPADQILFQLVESHKWWVDANYKETQMSRIKPNQPVDITVDMYPGVKFHGYVDSISRGSGTAFSLLPPENATGNWVKVTQRFPVKVIVVDPDPKHPLRVGSSSEVTVSTLKTYKPTN